jgi:hypothetical protein
VLGRQLLDGGVDEVFRRQRFGLFRGCHG